MEGIADLGAVHTNPAICRFFEAVADAEHFRGFSLAVNNREELVALAQARGFAIHENPEAARRRPDGTRVEIVQAPSIGASWSQGLPNWCCFPDPATHPSGRKVVAAPGLVRPLGIAWLEVGDDEATMSQWLGRAVSPLPIRFNGRAPGVYALAVRTSAGQVVIRPRE